ncbi:ABC transporter permease [Nocardia sp. CA-290969]|uniref:ABC transporter permease n=1 Tax=Nocardia sp. CA-290969 TaxID=3239986 RepID=UPI003D8B316B
MTVAMVTGHPACTATTAPAATRPGRTARLLRAALRTGGIPFASFGAALAAWYAVTYLVLAPERRFLLPAPHRVLTESLLDRAHVVPMLEALAVTARIAAIGFVLAAVLGVAVGTLMSRARWLERAIYPYAVVIQVIPILAIVPLIGLWFGYGTAARTLVCVIIAAFPIITNTLFGLQSVDRGQHELFTLGRASGWDRLIKLELPAALPAILTGIRTAAGLVVVGAIIGDMFFAKGEPGIGTLLDVYRSRLQSEDLFAAIVLASLFGVAVFMLFGAVSKALIGGWHTSAGKK